MQNSEAFWDNAAEKYAKSPIKDVAAYQDTLERTRSYLTPTDRVLELGCGTGSTALLLAPSVAHIVASDISGKMVAIGEQKARESAVPNAEFVAADLFEAKLDREPYDAVLAFNLLHLVEDRAGALRRISDLLKPNGFFISKTVCTPGKGSPLWLRLIPYAVPFLQMIGKAPYVKFMGVEAWEALLTSHGFEIVEARDRPPPSRYIVARKRGAQVGASPR
ncbi:MAG: class I SAM-dependent methyltransferase [Pseudomonadota bacterium]